MAQCRSSRTTRTRSFLASPHSTPARAAASSRVLPGPGWAAGPGSSGSRPASRHRASAVAGAASGSGQVSATSRPIEAVSTPAGSVAAIPAAAASTSRTGQKGRLCQSGRHRPQSTWTRSPISAVAARTRVDLPTPASPTSSTSRLWWAAWSRAPISLGRSDSRPTIGSEAGSTGDSPSASTTSTGWRWPRRLNSSAGPTSTMSRAARRVRVDRRIWSGSAVCWIRAAVCTAGPVTRRSPDQGPVATSPVSSPMRRCRGTSPRAVSAVLTMSRMASAARTARAASSSCPVGKPNTARMASPMYFSRVPPKRRTSAASRRKVSLSRSRAASGSSDSTRLVEPTRSAKSTVTTRRSSNPPARRSPQAGQKRAAAGVATPQAGQVMPAGTAPSGVTAST